MNDLRVAATSGPTGVPGTPLRAAAVRVAAAALVAAALSGCATLENGTRDEFYVLSEPAGANVTTTYGGSCVTPCKLDVNRKDEFTVYFEKAGYLTQSVKVATRLAGPEWATSRDVTADYLGRVVDFQDGAQFVHVPNPVSVKLTKIITPEG